tara:strand:- start:1030 stop:1650 length:621 start_codon:yes stop_codon:yes gene_type:complete
LARNAKKLETKTIIMLWKRRKKFGSKENMKVDVCHAHLIKSLITSNKPTNILEIGIGGGRSTDKILEGIEFNQNNPSFTLVDNWVDFGFVMPNQVKRRYAHLINIITSDEKDFILSTKDKYDFIMSDGDHEHTNEWFQYVYDKLLLADGILVYHDINLWPGTEGYFPNLREIYSKCKQQNIHHKLFNRSIREDERCRRGLLVIFKH